MRLIKFNGSVINHFSNEPNSRISSYEWMKFESFPQGLLIEVKTWFTIDV